MFRSAHHHHHHGPRRAAEMRTPGGRAFGRGWGGPPRGGRRRPRGDVRAAVLRLLGERPMHGYEMIQELEERSGGHWRPSAGSIYPALQLLEDQGLVQGEQRDGKRVFALTDAGREEADRAPEQTPPWEQAAEGEDAPEHRIGRAAFQAGAAAMQVAHTGSASQQERALELLSETRRRLYAILAEDE